MSKVVPLNIQPDVPASRNSEDVIVRSGAEETFKAEPDVVEARKYAETLAKIELLQDKITLLKVKHDEVLKKTSEQLKYNHELEQNIKHGTHEASELIEEERKKNEQNIQSKQVFVFTDWRKRTHRIQENRKKEVDVLKHELMQGMDFLQAQQELLLNTEKNETLLSQFASKIFSFFAFFIPFHSFINYLKDKYDNNVVRHFEFLRYLITYSLVFLLVFITFIVLHLLNYSGALTDVCNTTYFCFMFFSTITEGERVLYAWTLIVAMLVVMIKCGMSWSKQYTEYKKSLLLLSTKPKYSKRIFNFWNWTLYSDFECQSCLESGLRKIVTLLKEDRINSDYFFSKYLTRSIILLLEVVIACGGWGFIAYILYKSDEISNYFASVGPFAECIVPFVVVAVNNAIPRVLLILTPGENWELSRHKHISKLIKCFVPPLITLYIYFGMYLEFVLGKEYFATGGVIKLSPEYKCREDQAGANIYIFGLTEFLLNLIVTEFVNWNRRAFTDYKPRFYFEFCVVKLILLNATFCFSFIWFPFATTIYPLVLCLKFYYSYYMLKVHSVTYKTTLHETVNLLLFSTKK